MKSALTFNERVWRLTARIPRGRVSTYGSLAKALGQPKASRAVGNALNANPHAPRVPCLRRQACHRVVLGSGQLGGYALGIPAKAKILRQEGVEISPKNKVVDFAKVLYNGFLIKKV